MRVLVTGASGFLGAAIAQRISSHGIDVLGVSRSHASTQAYSSATLDLSNYRSVDHIIDWYRPTHLVHTAWYTEHGEFWDSHKNYQWVLITRYLIDRFLQHEGQHITIAGTCAEYELSCERTPLSEDARTLPNSRYGSCKHLTHLLAREAVDSFGATLAWLRIFLPFAENDQSRRLIPSIARQLSQEQSFFPVNRRAVRDFIHVSDIADAFRLVTSISYDGTLNVCSSNPVSIGELADSMAVAYGRPDQAPQSSERTPSYLVGSNHRLLGLGWKPTRDLSGFISSAPEGSWW